MWEIGVIQMPPDNSGVINEMSSNRLQYLSELIYLWGKFSSVSLQSLCWNHIDSFNGILNKKVGEKLYE